jgi:hypothetical protein
MVVVTRLAKLVTDVGEGVYTRPEVVVFEYLDDDGKVKTVDSWDQIPKTALDSYGTYQLAQLGKRKKA